MKRFWDQLTRRQKTTVAAGFAVTVAVLFAQFAVLPYLEARQQVRSAIAANQKALREMTLLAAEYDILRKRSEMIRRAIERRPAGFALLSYLDRRAGDAAVKGNVRSMTALKSVPAGDYEEAAVEMKLDKLTIKQLTDFFYLVESPGEMIRIRRISLSKMKESPEYLAALIQVSTYQRLAPGGG
jgi:type II secretory pathway component PulM